MKRDLLFSRDYPYPPELVWQALTDSDALEEWMMPNDFREKLGHQFEFRTDPKPGFDGITHCEIIELEPFKALAYTFKGGGLDTTVRNRLEPTSDGTRLIVEHTGFTGLRAYLISFLMQMGTRRLYNKNLPEILHGLSLRS